MLSEILKWPVAEYFRDFQNVSFGRKPVVIKHWAAAHYQRMKRKNVDLMCIVVFKDVLHMKCPAGNHPDA